MLEEGAVNTYSFLWAREAEAGEESGRKNRPSCLLIRPSSNRDILYMFAITSRPPEDGRIAEMLPALECRRCNLHDPAWIILDEYNISFATELHDFASLEPIGRFSDGFVKSVAEKAISVAKSGRARGVLRN
jgi:hypothetical protein